MRVIILIYIYIYIYKYLVHKISDTPSVSLRYNFLKNVFHKDKFFMFSIQKLKISIKLIEFIERLLVKKHWNLIISKNDT